MYCVSFFGVKSDKRRNNLTRKMFQIPIRHCSRYGGSNIFHIEFLVAKNFEPSAFAKANHLIQMTGSSAEKEISRKVRKHTFRHVRPDQHCLIRRIFNGRISGSQGSKVSSCGQQRLIRLI